MYLELIDTLSHIYRPQGSCGQGNIFTPVCHSFCSQGGSASVHAGIPSPQSRPPRADPPEQTPPPRPNTPPAPDTPRSRHPQSRHPPGSRHPWTRHPWTRHPLEQTPPQTRPPREQTQPLPPEQTPPTLPPLEQTPSPWSRQPPREADTPPGSRLQHTVYERPVRILLECILVLFIFGLD